MDLFEKTGETSLSKDAPLAWRLRPRRFDEFAGQLHVVGQGRLLRRLAENRRPVNLIIFGPPGTGKSALARLLAGHFHADLVSLNAVEAGTQDIRKLRQTAQDNQRRDLRTVLFLDEIHRFSRSQQDLLLPLVESGLVYLIGASTHNPSFAIIPALASRVTFVRFQALGREELELILERALSDVENGLGSSRISLSPDARALLLDSAGGDARRLLNTLEMAAGALPAGIQSAVLGLEAITEAAQQRTIGYDRDDHYDTISAFIKSMRGSDPDATIFWMAKMLEGGEDPLFIARRIVICASEDVGLADPLALLVAQAAMDAVERIGLPEGRIPLAQAALHVACAPKSNAAYKSLSGAQEAVRSGTSTTVPEHLRDASYRGASRLGHGEGYRYPHDYPGHHVRQEYLPSPARFFEPTSQGAEETIRRRLEELRARD